MRQNIHKMAMLVLVVMLTLTVPACGKKDKHVDSAVSLGEEYAWVSVPLEFAQDDVRLWNIAVCGNNLYYLRDQCIRSLSLTDGTVGAEVLVLPERSEDGNGSRNIERFCMDDDGKLYTVETLYFEDMDTEDNRRRNFLCAYDRNGVKLFEKEFTGMMQETENTHISSMTADSQGRVYLADDTTIFLFDQNGNAHGSIRAGEGAAYISGIGMDKNGVMCAVVDDHRNDDKIFLREIDFDRKEFGASYENFPGRCTNGYLSPGADKDFLASDESRVYEYDRESRSAETLFNWQDCDINGSDVICARMLEDGRILVVYNVMDAGGPALALLSRVNASEVTRKTEIVIGCYYEPDGGMLEEAVVRFNKSNDKYHVSIRNYYDWNSANGENEQQLAEAALSRINSDIVSANCPDILELGRLNVEQLAAKGVFEDLTPFIEKSDTICSDDYLESVLNCYTYNGILLAIPRRISLMTVAGKTSEVGTEPGWTLDEMIAYADAHPDAAVFDYTTKTNILRFLASYNLNSYVDWESGRCSFDTDSFQNLLCFADRFPENRGVGSSDNRSTPAKIADGDVLLQPQFIDSFQSIQLAEEMFGEPVTFIGYPNDGGTGGCYIQAEGLLAITTKARDKEGAWAFVESYLIAKSKWHESGIPTDKKELQTAMEKATTMEYASDEDENLLLDEDGNPIPQDIGSTIVVSGEGTTSYERHVTTQEEADKLLRLLEIARPVTDSDAHIMNIIEEEAEAYFAGQKSVSDVTEIIQRRVRLYMDENR